MYTSSIASASSTVEGCAHPTGRDGAGVCVSRNRGMRMSTLAPRRLRMLPVSAAKRGCGLMQSSGTKSDLVTGPPAGSAGSVNSPTPISGKHGIVGQISSGSSTASSRARRVRMLRSTERSAEAVPVYGCAGVPSTIQAPYSGTQLHPSDLVPPFMPASPSASSSACSASSCSRSLARISAPRSLQRTVPSSPLALRMEYSSSSPHLRSSHLMAFTFSHIAKN